MINADSRTDLDAFLFRWKTCASSTAPSLLMQLPFCALLRVAHMSQFPFLAPRGPTVCC
jgi:hypothetical protein